MEIAGITILNVNKMRLQDLKIFMNIDANFKFWNH